MSTPDLRVMFKVTPEEMMALSAALAVGEPMNKVVEAVCERVLEAWDRRGNEPEVLKKDEPVAAEPKSEALSPNRHHGATKPDGVIRSGLRCQVVKHVEDGPDARAFAEVGLWVPSGRGDYGSTIYCGVGLEDLRAYVGVLRAGVRDLENVYPRLA